MSTPSAVWVMILLALLRDMGRQVSIKLFLVYMLEKVIKYGYCTMSSTVQKSDGGRLEGRLGG